VVRTKSPEGTARRYAQNCLRAYLEGKKNLNWVVGVIRESGVRGARLADIFERFRDYGDSEGHHAAKAACEMQDWTPQICEHLADTLTTSGPVEETEIFCVKIEHAREVAKERQGALSSRAF